MINNEMDRRVGSEWLKQLVDGDPLVFRITRPDGKQRLYVNGKVYGLPFNRKVTLFSDFPEQGGAVGWINDITLAELRKSCIKFIDGDATVDLLGNAKDPQFAQVRWGPTAGKFESK